MRAEQLFAIRPEESEGTTARRRDQQPVLLVRARRPAGGSDAAVGARGDPRRSRGRLGSALRAADVAHVARARHVAVVSVLRNVTDLGRARQELEDNYRRLMQAETQMRTERNRLDLLVDSVGDPIIVTDPAGDILMTNSPAERFFTPADTAASRRSAACRPTSRSSRRSSRAHAAERRERHPAALAGAAPVTDPETGRAVPMEAVAGTMMSGPSELDRRRHGAARSDGSASSASGCTRSCRRRPRSSK